MSNTASASTAESILARAWARRGLLASALWPVSLLFGGLAFVRRALFGAGLLRSTRLPVPVIVVGNIFVGGTGKTPFTIWLVERLREGGFHPGVISRGYGASGEAPRSVTPDSSPARDGDEPVLIAQRACCAVVVGRDRVSAARELLKLHPEVDVLVSDDGLQHYAMARDVEIVLCDARGNGNGWLLPAGPLREPPSRKRDFTVFNAERAPAGLPADAFRMELQYGRACQLANRRTSMELGAFSGRIVAAAGIGNPSRFFSMLRKAGLSFREIPLPDHYDYAVDPFAGIDADIILLTEKDAVKCERIDTLKNDPRLWVVPVTARIDGALPQRILEKCRGRPTP
jgi:tetraacyldisaccharide 4'-kinase